MQNPPALCIFCGCVSFNLRWAVNHTCQRFLEIKIKKEKRGEEIAELNTHTASQENLQQQRFRGENTVDLSAALCWDVSAEPDRDTFRHELQISMTQGQNRRHQIHLCASVGQCCCFCCFWTQTSPLPKLKDMILFCWQLDSCEVISKGLKHCLITENIFETQSWLVFPLSSMWPII